jgi:hypothetical protein
MVHDSDIFFYWLADSGTPLDDYDSDPGYFEALDTPPQGGGVEVLMRHCNPGVSAHRLDGLLHQKISAADDAGGATASPNRLARLLADQQTRLDAAIAQFPERAAELHEAIREQNVEMAASFADLAANGGQADEPGTGSFAFVEPMMEELAEYLGISPGRVQHSFRYLQQGEGEGAMLRVGCDGARAVKFERAPAAPP